MIDKLITPWLRLSRGDSKDYFSTFIATAVIQVLGVVTGVLTARLLGPIGKGEVTTVLWLPSLISSAGLLSLPQAVAFQVSRELKSGDTISAVGFWVALVLGITEVVILFPLVPAILGSNAVHLADISRAYLIYLPAAFIGMTLLGADQGAQRFTRYNILKVLPPILYVFGLALLAFAKRATVTNVILVSLLGQLVASAIRIGFMGRRLLVHGHHAVSGYAKGLVKQGLVFSLPALSGILLMSADVALLIHMVSAEQLGFYAVALAIALGQTGVAAALVQVNFPKVSSASKEEAKIILRHQFEKAVMPLIGMGTVVAFFAPFLIKYLFGQRFAPSLSISYILIGAIAICGIGQVLENGLRGMGYSRPGTIANIGGLMVLIVGAFFLVPLHRAAGMAASVFLAQATALALLLFSFRRILAPKKIYAGLGSD